MAKGIRSCQRREGKISEGLEKEAKTPDRPQDSEWTSPRGLWFLTSVAASASEAPSLGT